MPKRFLSDLFGLGMKKNLVSIILICNAFVWYFSVLSSLESTYPSTLVLIVHFSALILSALAGASLARQMERSRFLILWMTLGIMTSLMLSALRSPSEMLSCLVSLCLGLSFGFGMPACMSYFTDNVPIESRGRVSGLALFASGMGIVAFGFAEVSDMLLTGLILGVWRLLSLLVFLWAKDYRKVERKDSIHSYKQVLSRHSFVLYFVPWVMFSLVNYLLPITPFSGVETGTSEFAMVQVVQAAFMGGAAVLGGFFADSMGRKPIAIAGFSMLGVGAAVLGFLGNTPLAALAIYFNAMVDGVAFGFLLLLFVLTLWGDLSRGSSSDKYYAAGVMPFFASQLLQLTVGPYIVESINANSAPALFSFTAFFLFLAVLPLFFAPETLPEKVKKERDLKFYIEKAQKVAQKYY
jgi:MFS family permease